MPNLSIFEVGGYWGRENQYSPMKFPALTILDGTISIKNRHQLLDSMEYKKWHVSGKRIWWESVLQGHGREMEVWYDQHILHMDEKPKNKILK